MNVRRRTHTMGVGAWYNRNANIYCTIKERVLPAVAVRPHVKSNKTIISAEWPTFKRWKKCIFFCCSGVVSFRLFSSIKSWESESTCCVYATRGPQWEGIHFRAGRHNSKIIKFNCAKGIVSLDFSLKVCALLLQWKFFFIFFSYGLAW